jgi:hypothetical protein
MCSCALTPHSQKVRDVLAFGKLLVLLCRVCVVPDPWSMLMSG